MEKTLAIIKPDGVARGLIGEVIKRIEKEHLEIWDMKMFHMSREQAVDFYREHEGKAFFNAQVDFMCSGPVVVLILDGPYAVQRWRTLMGLTNSSEAARGTIRGDLGSLEVIRYNVVHGSDSPESADSEIKYFFS